jgi:hypothetical protein
VILIESHNCLFVIDVKKIRPVYASNCFRIANKAQ